jgi:hypothetical protein
VVNRPFGVGLYDECRIFEFNSGKTAATGRSCLRQRIGIDDGAQRWALRDRVERFDVVSLRSENESLDW